MIFFRRRGAWGIEPLAPLAEDNLAGELRVLSKQIRARLRTIVITWQQEHAEPAAQIEQRGFNEGDGQCSTRAKRWVRYYAVERRQSRWVRCDVVDQRIESGLAAVGDVATENASAGGLEHLAHITGTRGAFPNAQSANVDVAEQRFCCPARCRIKITISALVTCFMFTHDYDLFVALL
jgi:hypothetical protein